ncbi:hypothetical protein GCM10010531_24830 [Blastococcus jejuensis]|uniref:Tryptophan-associated transmembrane protein (Trp_oprn_chp) n=1 Tax=Blastococcus jejuensis TaxID=351224 RepID=A0ABP6P8V3_9ACTN
MSQDVGARRELTSAVVAAAAAGGLALTAGSQAWAQVTVGRAAPLPPTESTLSGADAAPLVPAAGLVLLAAAVALLAVRGVARVATGLLVALAGGTLAWSGLRVLIAGVRVDDVGGAGAEVGVDVAVAWPVLAVVAGAVGVGAGALVVLHGRAWPGMGQRYERTGSASTVAPASRTDEDRAQDAWKALDRGEDPTAVATPHADPPPGGIQRRL